MNGNARMLRLTRRELYERIWSEPVAKIAKDLGTTTFTLGKLFIKHRIPKPSMAYWAKIKSGQKVQRAALWTVEDKSLELIQLELTPDALESRTPRTKSKAFEIPVPSSLDSPHPLVRLTLAGLELTPPDLRGLVRSPHPQSLNVRVGKDSILRAMLVMDTLIKGLEARGYSVTVDKQRTLIAVEDQQIEIALREVLGQRKPTEEELGTYSEQMKAIRNYMEKRPGEPLPPYQLCIESVSRVYFPSGQLVLSIEDHGEGYRNRWRDTKRQRLEDCLGSFITELVTVAEMRKAERQKREKQAEPNGPKDHRQVASEAGVKKAELHPSAIVQTPAPECADAIEALEQFAARWEKAQRLRRFLSAVQAQNYPKESVGKWLEWAHRYVDSIDPLCGSFEPR